MSDFSSIRAEMSDMELATTSSRIKGRRRKRTHPVTTATHTPPQRGVSEASRPQRWRLLGRRCKGSFGGFGRGS